MLSPDMQRMILNMYYYYATTSNKSITYDQLRDLYTSKLSFKRAAKYLEVSKYLQKNRIDYNKVEYSLTMSGEMLARLLCSLPDIPEQFKAVKWRIIL